MRAPRGGIRHLDLEADRDFNKKNAVADLDSEWFFKGFYNPLEKQNRLRLLAARRAQNNPDLQMDEVTPASLGTLPTSSSPRRRRRCCGSPWRVARPK